MPPIIYSAQQWNQQRSTELLRLTSEYGPEDSHAAACIDGQVLTDLIERFGKAWTALPSVYDDKKNPPPLELVVLDRALYLLEEFLKLEQERRKYDPDYAAECKGANETKRYRDTHDGAWPPEVLGGQADG